MENKSKTGDAKLLRTEVVSVRLDPKLRFGAELAARRQRRSLSSFIEWAVEDVLKRLPVYELDDPNVDQDPTIMGATNQVWDVDDADRFVNLARHFSHFLTYDEQILWKAIRENGAVWKGQFNSNGRYEWDTHFGEIDLIKLRRNWPNFKQVAKGELSMDDLPEWISIRDEENQIEYDNTGQQFRMSPPFPDQEE